MTDRLSRSARLLRLAIAGGITLCLGLACIPTAPPPASPTPTMEVDVAGLDNDETEGAKPGSSPTSTPRPLPTTTATRLRSDLVQGGLVLPQSLAFAPDGRLFFVQIKQGLIRVIKDGQLQEAPVASMSVSRGAEHGLVSLSLDPNFATNHYIYTYYTEPQSGNSTNRPRRHRLTRWVEKDGLASSETVVLDNLPTGKCCHTGGKMVFAADGSLFLAIGDQGDADRRDAQNPNKLNGKLLHFNVEQVMRDNPDPRTLIYSSGLRNPYGVDVHPMTGSVWLTDNGPDMCDELNLASPGANFGNPAVECTANNPSYVDPAWESGVDRLGVTGLRVYRGAMFPELQNDVLFCSVNTGNLMRAVLSRPGFDHVERVEQVVSGADGNGCRLDLATAPDGSIFYASTSGIYRLSRG